MKTKQRVSPWPNEGSLHTYPVRDKIDNKIVAWRWCCVRATQLDMRSEPFPTREHAEQAASELFDVKEWVPMPTTREGRTVAVPT